MDCSEWQNEYGAIDDDVDNSLDEKKGVKVEAVCCAWLSRKRPHPECLDRVARAELSDLDGDEPCRRDANEPPASPA